MRLVRRQPGKAARAAATARWASSAVPRGKTPTTSAQWAGLWLSNEAPLASSQWPAMRCRPVKVGEAVADTMTQTSTSDSGLYYDSAGAARTPRLRGIKEVRGTGPVRCYYSSFSARHNPNRRVGAAAFPPYNTGKYGRTVALHG